ncbi:alpha-N-acetylgalactosamine-specific lectin-like [Dunckerocampus dactyliophorus]|uniref:alpha-N-acetylgalactosamine-specific lectin-like n=1 Tax=Dunckerocampus dactyliophorus TaxID=161453 RepID=UPI002405A3CF|nr:alpha-N-acetylgalactosamine-specific lectin-like [Dunckerocampus dactyliophorus]
MEMEAVVFAFAASSITTAKMAFSVRVFFLLCGVSGLLTGAWSWDRKGKDECCPKDWTRLDDHCYIVYDDARTFADAESICNILGGNLASVSSALKNAVIYELVQAEGLSDAWIGLHDAIEDGDFIWTDGKPLDFENFEGGAPDGMGDCVHISTRGEWFDIDCTTEEAYVCITEVYCP